MPCTRSRGNPEKSIEISKEIPKSPTKSRDFEISYAFFLFLGVSDPSAHAVSHYHELVTIQDSTHRVALALWPCLRRQYSTDLHLLWVLSHLGRLHQRLNHVRLLYGGWRFIVSRRRSWQTYQCRLFSGILSKRIGFRHTRNIKRL